MADLPTGQISNHYEMRYWQFFDIPEKERADVASIRLSNFVRKLW